MSNSTARRAHPWLWVPTLYFAEGTPMIAVSMVAAVMYKNLGVSNADIALYTGMMYLPWTIKPLWAPIVEIVRTKRFFVISMELVMAVTFVALGLALRMPSFLALTIGLFWVTGFASATQDIAADGVYIASMSPQEQANYAGIQGMFWNLGKLLTTGPLVSLTGYLHDGRGLDWPGAWQIIMTCVAVIMAAMALWHLKFLPPGDVAQGAKASLKAAFSTMGEAWVSFFKKPHIAMMLSVVFFYRFGEGFIEKMGPLFLMDKRSVGGLGMLNSTLGHINGTFGTVAYIGGTLLGGLLAGRYGLKRLFVPLAFALNVPHITYFYLSQALPSNLPLITTVVTIEKLGYGFGSVGLILYMMQQLAPGKFRTAHYAFATGIMAACMMVTGMISGALQQWLGHKWFFAFVLAVSVPPIIIAKLAPFREPGEIA
jgi:MFS transporter, PAT family, beta-lactamase induction signal transducer AmpG